MRKITSGKLEIKGKATFPKDPSKGKEDVNSYHVSGAIG